MSAKLHVGNGPCWGGVLEFNIEGQAAGYAQALNEMAEAGFSGTDRGDWGFMPTESIKLRDELATRKLTLVSAFVPVPLAKADKHAEGEAVALRTARLLAETTGKEAFIVLADDNGKDPVRTQNAGRIKPEQGLSAEQWKVFAEGANRIAQSVCDQTGLRTVFHHHCAGYVETPAEVDTFLKLTDPTLIGLCLDTGHYAYAGGDPVRALTQYKDRLWLLHFKDCEANVARQARTEGWDYFKAVSNGVFCELGKGAVDFPAVADAIKAIDYEGWIIVEQDVLPGMGTPLESARRNRAYLRSIGL